jgi:hypothetical protein
VTVTPATATGISSRIIVHTGTGKNARPYLKIKQSKRAGVMAQVVKHLPNECKTPSSNLSTKKHEIIGLSFTDMKNLLYT